MAEANVDSTQQSQDAQTLDNLTSLQQADTGTTTTATGGTADAVVTTTNPPAPDTPSLFNETTGTNNNQPNFEAATTNSLLDTTTFTNDGRDGTANESPTIGSGIGLGTDVNTGESEVQYTVTNENPIIQGAGTNGTQNTVGGIQGTAAAAAPTESTATTEAAPTTTTTDAPTTNSTPEPIVNPDGSTPTDPAVDPLLTDPVPQEPVTILVTPELSVTKDGDISTGADSDIDAGDIVTYTVEVTNTGNTDLADLVIRDAKLNTAEHYQISVDDSEVPDTYLSYQDLDGVPGGQSAWVVTELGGTEEAPIYTRVGTEFKLAVGSVLSFEYDYAISETEWLDGKVDNTVFVDSDKTNPEIDDVSTTGKDGVAYKSLEIVTPELSVTKDGDISTGADSDIDAGDIVTYTVEVTNTGNTDLADLVIRDAKLNTAEHYQISVDDSEVPDTYLSYQDLDGVPGGQSAWVVTELGGTEEAPIYTRVGTEFKLAVGSVLSFEYDYAISETEWLDGKVDNTVFVDSDKTNPEIDDVSTTGKDGVAYKSLEIVTPELSVTKDGDISTGADSDIDAGDIVTYTVEVTNTGNTDLADLVIRDAKLNTAEHYQISVDDSEVPDTYLSYQDLDGVPGGQSAWVVTELGGTEEAPIYTRVGTEFKLAVGSVLSFEYDYAISETEWLDGKVDNTVFVDSDKTNPEIDDVSTTGKDGVAYKSLEIVTPELSVTKDGDISTGADSDIDAGDIVTYTVEVTNTGNTDLADLVIRDAKLNTAEHYQISVDDSEVPDTYLSYQDLDGVPGGQSAWVVTELGGTEEAPIYTRVGTEFKLAVGSVLSFEYDYAISETEWLDGKVDNTVFVDSDKTNPEIDDVSTTGKDGVAYKSLEIVTPELSVTKDGDISTGADSDIDAGDIVTYTVEVTNTGNTDLADLVIRDAKLNTAEHYQISVDDSEVPDTYLSYQDLDGVPGGQSAWVVTELGGTEEAPIYTRVGTEFKLAVGSVLSFEYDYAISETEWLDGKVDNTVFVDSDKTNPEIDDVSTTGKDGVAYKSLEIVTPELSVTKDGDISTGADSDIDAGDIVTYTVEVTNTGNTDLADLVIRDAKLNTAEHYQISVDDSEVPDTYLSYQDLDGVPGGQSAWVVTELGGTEEAPIYTRVGTEFKLAVGSVLSFEYDYAISETEWLDGKVDNTVFVDSDKTNPEIDDVSTTGKDGVAYKSLEIVTPELSVTKDGDISTGADSDIDAGDIVTYTVEVTNTGNTDLADLVIRDAKLNTAEHYQISVDDSEVPDTYLSYQDLDGVPGGQSAWVVTELGGTEEAPIYTRVGTEFKLAVGSVLSFEYDYAISETEWLDGKVDNTVFVDSDKTNPEIDDVSTTGKDGVAYKSLEIVTPELSVTKDGDISTGADSDIDAGDIVTYTVEVTNTGNTDLADLVIRDAKLNTAEHYQISVDDSEVPDTYLSYQDLDGVPGGQSAWVVTELGGTEEAPIYTRVGTEFKLAVGSVLSFEYDYAISETEWLDGKVDNTVFVDSDKTNPEIDDVSTTGKDGVAYKSLEIVTPELSVTKDGDISTGADSDIDAGDIVTYTVEVTNTGNTDLADLVIRDAKLNTAEHYQISVDDSEVPDTYLSYQDLDGVPGGQSAWVVTELGGTEEAPIYTRVGTEFKLAVGSVLSFEYDYAISETEWLDGKVDNTVFVDSDKTNPEIDDVSTTGKDGVAYKSLEIVTPELSVTKDGDISTGADSDIDAGDIVTYTVEVTNTGNTDLADLVIRDAKLNTAEHYQISVDDSEVPDTYLSYQDLDGVPGGQSAWVVTELGGTEEAPIYTRVGTEFKLAVGSVLSFEYDYAISETEWLDGKVDNTVFVDSDKTNPEIDDVSTTGKDGVAYKSLEIVTPELSVTKDGDISTGADSDIDAGDIVTYTVEVTNTGNTDLADLVIRDAKLNTAEHYQISVDDSEVPDTYLSYQDLDGVPGGQSAWVVTELGGTEEAPIYTRVGTEFKLAVGSVLSFEYDYAISETEWLDGKVDNTVFVDSDKTNPEIDDVSTTGKDGVAYKSLEIVTPELSVTKQAVVTDIYNDDFGGTSGATGNILNDAQVDLLAAQAALNAQLALPAGEQDLVVISDARAAVENAQKIITGVADSAGDMVAYTLVIQNEGNTDLTNVRIYDSMFERMVDTPLAFADLTPGGNVDLILVDGLSKSLELDSNGKHFISIANLQANSPPILINYTYLVQSKDIDDMGVNTAGVSDADGDIDNVAYATSDQANTEIVSYEVGVVFTPVGDVAIYKEADVTSVEGEGQTINYKLTVTNEGMLELTNVQVVDKMFTGSPLEVRVFGPGLSAAGELLLVNSDWHLSDGVLTIDNLEIGQYAEITYTYVVDAADFGAATNVEKSILDYVGNGPQGYLPFNFSYGTFEAYVNKDGTDPYDVGGDPAQVYVNVDNTGVAVGVNAGVMSGDRNANSDHLKAVFKPSQLNAGNSLVEGASIVFTNSKSVEMSFKVNVSSGPSTSDFIGSIIIGEQGDVSLREITGSAPNYDRTGISIFNSSTSTYTFSTDTNSNFNSNGWGFRITETDGPGGAQNKIYTLNFDGGTQFVNSFDFWVVGNTDDNALEQIKVVDVKFDVLDFGDAEISNTATVSSYQDAGGGADEVSTKVVTVTSELSVADAELAIALGETKVSVKDTELNILNASDSLINKIKGTHLTVVKNDGSIDSSAAANLSLNTRFAGVPVNDKVGVITLSDTSIKKDQLVTVTVEFSQGVKELELTDFIIPNGVATPGSLTHDANSKVWSFTFTANSNVEDASNIITLDGQFKYFSVVNGASVESIGKAITSSNYSIDTKPPAAPTIDKVATDDIVTVEENKNLVISGSGEIGATVTLVKTGQTAVVGSDGRWSIAVADALTSFGQGEEPLSVTQTDAMGNQGAPVQKVITVSVFDTEAQEDDNKVSFYAIKGASDSSIYIKANSLYFTDQNQPLNGIPNYSVQWQNVISDRSGNETGTNIPGATGFSYSPSSWGSSLIRVVITTTDRYDQKTVFTSQSFSPNNLNSTTEASPYTRTLSKSATPIAMDLNGDGIQYVDAASGVKHDFNHDGIAESTAWVAPEDGLLALQKDDGTHNIVFSTQAGETDLQGLAKVYDSNKDGMLDQADADFAKFGVWQDADSDGVVDSGEYLSLADRGITSLSLTSDGQVHFEANGDVIVYGQTTYTTSDGQLHIAEDVGFAVSDVYEPLDIATIIANADAIESVTHIDQSADTASSSSLMVELGGQTYEIATLAGQEAGTQDILSQFVGGDTSANLLTNKSWTDVIDISSDHGGPGSIIAAGGTLNEGNYANGEGDWTVIINSGDAKVDATNNQITFASESADNSVTIITADGASHDINNVDKIQWHG